jgi:hypothetical protein
MVAEWFTPVGTLALAVVAIFHDTIRSWFYRPEFQASIQTAPPDCVAVPFARVEDGTIVTASLYLRLWVRNIGNATANNAEAYVGELLQQEQINHGNALLRFLR